MLYFALQDIASCNYYNKRALKNEREPDNSRNKRNSNLEINYAQKVRTKERITGISWQSTVNHLGKPCQRMHRTKILLDHNDHQIIMDIADYKTAAALRAVAENFILMRIQEDLKHFDQITACRQSANALQASLQLVGKNGSK